jgi:hypothetical protein
MTKQIEAQNAAHNAIDDNSTLTDIPDNMSLDIGPGVEETEVEETESVEELLINLIDPSEKQTLKSLTEKINEIIEVVNKMDPKPQGDTVRDTVRDIKSDRPMTEEDARAVLLGNLEDISTKQAALELGLSYGQVYSCRKGFTFKKVYKEFREAQA